MKPPVVLYVPAYNVARFLPACLAAARAQTYALQEIVVIDDGSTDESASVAEAHGARVIRHPRNLGLAQARHTAFREIDAPLIASLDADCQPEPTWLAILMHAMRNPAVAGACGVLIESHRDGLADGWRASHMPQTQGRRRIHCPAMIFGNNNVFRRQAVLEAGNYPLDTVYRTNNEDYFISRRLRERGWRLQYEPTARVFHARTDSTMSIARTYWRWWFLHRILPNSLRRTIAKSRDNASRGVECARRDLRTGRWRLVAFDMLLFPLLQSFFDIDYYLSNKGVDVPESYCS